MFLVYGKELQKDGGSEIAVSVVSSELEAGILVTALQIRNAESDLSYGYRPVS